jgi:hypothetical protein
MDVSLPGEVTEAWLGDADGANVQVKTMQSGIATYWVYLPTSGRFDEIDAATRLGGDANQFVVSTSVSGTPTPT